MSGDAPQPREPQKPLIAINGMAHVVLTVSDFPRARAVCARLLPACGMRPVFDGP